MYVLSPSHLQAITDVTEADVSIGLVDLTKRLHDFDGERNMGIAPPSAQYILLPSPDACIITTQRVHSIQAEE